MKPVNGAESIYLFKFPAESVVEIIVGRTISYEHRAMIAKIRDDSYSKATLHEAALSETEYDLEIRPLTHARAATSR